MPVVRRMALIIALAASSGCGRDAVNAFSRSGADPGDASPPLDSDVGLLAPDTGLIPPDTGLPGLDVGLLPDFGAGPDFGSSPDVPDFGAVPDLGSSPDFGGSPDVPDFGSGSDFGVIPDIPDFGSAPDSGSLPDVGTMPDIPDLGAGPDFGPGPDFGSSPDSGPGPDLGTPACPGDTCADAIALSSRVGLHSVVGNTSCASDDTGASCAAAGRDVVHSISLGRRRRIVARANSVAGGFPSALSLRSTCTAPATELVCDAGGPTGLAALDTFVDPGTYYLWLDAATAGASGNYRVDVEIDPQDTCADPIKVDAPAVGSSVEIEGDTTGARNVFGASCAGAATSPDHVIAVRVATRIRLRAETLTPTSGNPYDTALHLREACSTGVGSPELACDDDGGAGTLSAIEVTLGPGTYHLVVDGFAASSSGRYRLRLTSSAAAAAVRFPVSTDFFQTGATPAFDAVGDSVQGTRSPAGLTGSVNAIDQDIRLSQNGLAGASCSILFRVLLNNSSVGFFRVSGGDTQVRQTLNVFTGATAPLSLRYEVFSGAPANCGAGVIFDTTNSTVTFNP